MIVGVPPLVRMFWLYDVPTVPFGTVMVAMLSTGLMVMPRVWFLVCCGVPESVAETVKLAVPAAVGDPEILPELIKVNPDGKLPWETLQVIVPVPPPLCNVAL